MDIAFLLEQVATHAHHDPKLKAFLSKQSPEVQNIFMTHDTNRVKSQYAEATFVANNSEIFNF